jgi:hypothetical protein
MAELAAEDLTIVVTDRSIAGSPKKRHNHGTMAIAGTDDYTAGGLPVALTAVSAAKRFGMDRQLDYVSFYGDVADGDPGTASVTSFQYSYNPLTEKIVLYQAAADGDAFDEADGSTVVGPRTVHWYAIGW